MRCDPAKLKVLLHGDESSHEFQIAAEHIESCDRCRKQLENMSTGNMPWWTEARESLSDEGEPEIQRSMLSSSITIEVESSLADDTPVEFEKVSLDFLSPASHPELLGRLGRYDIERVVGTGGMGVVLKAYDTELHRIVAVKVLAPHLAHSAAARKRFSREAQAAAAVVHPHVIPIHNVESDGKLPYLVMQYVPGQSLQARVDHDGPLAIADTLRIAQQAAAGLSAAHAQGLVHRDVKPANILLEEKVDRVLLSDFGLARAVDDASLTRTGIVAGTPFYMSPEQARGDAIDYRSDLFSLGSVIYFMLTGRPPFRASGAMAVLNRICHEPHRPIDQINPDVPDELCNLVDRLLSKSPSKRFASAQEAEAKIGELLSLLQRGQLTLRRRSQAQSNTPVTTPAVAPWMIGVTIISVATLGWFARDMWLQTTTDTTFNKQPIQLPRTRSPHELTIRELNETRARLEALQRELETGSLQESLDQEAEQLLRSFGSARNETQPTSDAVYRSQQSLLQFELQTREADPFYFDPPSAAPNDTPSNNQQ